MISDYQLLAGPAIAAVFCLAFVESCPMKFNPILRDANSEDLEAIRPLWQALYLHQSEHGMRIWLPPDGAGSE
jgi:hypothetical protein